MQEKQNGAVETAKVSVDNVPNKIIKGSFQANKDKSVGVYFPEFWRKKKLNKEFVSRLEKTAKSEPVMEDEHGEYRVGAFLFGCAIVFVSVTNDLWSAEIHSEHPIGLPMIQDVRYKFLPDAFLMSYLLPSRAERSGNNVAVLYQIPGSLLEDQNEEKEGE